MSNTSLLYFAFGSNLLSTRIHFNVPSAKRKDIGVLKDFRLDFNGFSRRWKGAAATIVPENGTQVWGAIWEIDENEKSALDAQENVSEGIYSPLKVQIKNANSQIFECLTYQMCQSPKDCGGVHNLPHERKPSMTYLDTILEGAQESNLPQEYISMLRTIPHNGFSEKVNMKNSY